MELLSKRFPENIKLFAAYKDETMLAGVTMFEHKSIAHAQYFASSDEGDKVGAGDLVWDYLIHDYYSGSSKRYFDFGRSTEKGGSIPKRRFECTQRGVRCPSYDV